MPARICGYCQRQLTADQKSFCSRRCSERAQRTATNLAKIQQGKTCRRCGKPRPSGNAAYCSAACHKADRIKLRRCVICGKQWQGGTPGTCSDKCAYEVTLRRSVRERDARWLAATFDQPGLETVPQRTALWRRPLVTASGKPCVLRCWNETQVTEFPTDPAVRFVIWKDAKNVYAQGLSHRDARHALLRLTDHDVRMLPQGPVRVGIRTVKPKEST